MTRRDDKKLLPEILPAPTKTRAFASPRQRTLGQMNRLLALAATSAAIGACEKPSPKEQGSKVINVPQPKESAASDMPDTPLPPRDSATATTPDPSATTPIEPPTGYAVVDPMPPPASCVGLASTVKASTKWKSAKLLQIELGTPSMPNSSYDASTAPQVYGGTVKTKTITKKHVTLVIELAKDSSYVTAYVSASCPSGTQHLSISITSNDGSPLAKATPFTLNVGDTP